MDIAHAVNMHLPRHLACLLSLLPDIRANPVGKSLNITNIYSSALSDLKDLSAVACLPPAPGHAPIHDPDCFVLENDILLSRDTRIPRLWGLIGMNYPRNYRECSIQFVRAGSGGDPLEKFPEYQMAIAAAVIVDRCRGIHYGGIKYVTRSQQFAATVKNPNHDSEEDVLLPGTNITESELSTNLTRVTPVSNISANDTAAISPSVSGLNATVSCYPPAERAQPIDRGDCYDLFHNMLLRPDILTSHVWVGRNPHSSEGPWSSGSCKVEVIGRSSLSTGYFKLIDPLVAAAQVAQTCFVDRGVSFGGVISVPDQRWFTVRVSSARALAANTTAVESA